MTPALLADWPEKPQVGRAFSRAAASYDTVAELQRQVGEQLLAQMQDIPATPSMILDLGAGTGYCTARLAQIFPVADWVALDIALGMLRTLRERPGLPAKVLCICGDGEFLPLRVHSVDLVFSNLALQWCADLAAVLAEFRRVLKPGGVALFSTFGEGTLCELREAWAAADGYSHVNAFVSESAVATAMAEAGCSGYTVSGERRVLSYCGVGALLRELKALGAHNVTHGRARHLTGKTAFRKMVEAYPSNLKDGRVEASFEIIYGAAYFGGKG